MHTVGRFPLLLRRLLPLCCLIVLCAVCAVGTDGVGKQYLGARGTHVRRDDWKVYPAKGICVCGDVDAQKKNGRTVAGSTLCDHGELGTYNSDDTYLGGSVIYFFTKSGAKWSQGFGNKDKERKTKGRRERTYSRCLQHSCSVP